MPLNLFKRDKIKNWYVRGTVAGQSIYESTGTADRAQAKEYRDKRQSDLWKRHVYGEKATMTFEEYRDAPRLEQLRYRAYRNPIILFLFGPLYTFVIAHRFLGLGGSSAERRSVILANLTIAVIGVAASVLFGFWTYVAVQLPVILFAGSIGIWLFYVQHQFDPGYWARDEKWNQFAAAMYVIYLGARYSGYDSNYLSGGSSSNSGDFVRNVLSARPGFESDSDDRGECRSDLDCSSLDICVKPPLSGLGICVNDGGQTRLDPDYNTTFSSFPRGANNQGRRDCPIGTRWDLIYQACIN